MAPTFTSVQLEQFRRDAKRLRKSQSLSQAQALDAVAAQHGFQNWSLLMRRVDGPVSPPSLALVPASVPAADKPVVTLRELAGYQGPRMEASRAETMLIAAIAKRFSSIVGRRVAGGQLELMMDLEACHCNGCPLDFEALLGAPRDEDVVHDVAGIRRHLNRDTGVLEEFFRPRYAAV